eukprot:symbB.v1.2.012980.t2/scaffold908.1/size153097/13
MSLLLLSSLVRGTHLHVIGTTSGQWILICCVFLFLQCAGTVVWIASGGNDEFSTSLNDSWWISYTLLVDIGTQTGLPATERNTIKFVCAVISLVGFVYFLTLLGMVVDLIRDFLNDLRTQFSSVRAQGHWLILGWGDKTLLLIDELLTSIASAPRPPGCCGCRRRRQIVILADMPTQQMTDEVQVHCLADPLLTRLTTLFFPIVCYKQGNPTDVSELLAVSAPNARDILVARTSENGHLSDLKAISSLLALAAMPKDSPMNGDVWVEVCQEQSLRTVKTILPESHGIVARKVVNRIMVLRALVPSVGFVFLSMTSASFANKSQSISGKSQLLTPTVGRAAPPAPAKSASQVPPAKLQLVPTPALVCGLPFREVGPFFPDAVVCGVRPSGVHQSIIPDGQYCLKADDILVLIAPTTASAQRCMAPPKGQGPYPSKVAAKGEMHLVESLVKSDGQLCLGPSADGAKALGRLGGMAAADASNMIELQVLCMTGEAVTLKVDKSMLGREVRQMVSTQLPGKAGAKMALHHMDAKLVPAESLEQQGIGGKTATLFCTYMQTDLYSAWRFVKGLPTPEAEFALEGVTSLEVQTKGEYFFHLPTSLRSLILQEKKDSTLNKFLSGLALPNGMLPNGMQINPSGDGFSLKGVTLPRSLQNLTFGYEFDESLEGVTLPSSLQNLTFCGVFNQSLERVTLPSSLQNLTLGTHFDRSLEGVTLPSSLQNLTFGKQFNKSLEGVTLPSSLKNLTFGDRFNQSLEGVTLPSSLQKLTMGTQFNQSLEGVTLPSSLQKLTFGYNFNQSLEGVTLPSSLQNLTFGYKFNQSLEGVTLPNSLQNLTLRKEVDGLHQVSLLPNLRRFCIEETIMILELGCPGAGDIAEILDTIDVHVTSGSSVHILSRTPASEREEWIQQHLKLTGRTSFHRITVQQHEGESTNKWDMTKLPLETAHCALILAERLRDDESTLAVDSRNLTSAIFLKQKLDEMAGPGLMGRSISTATNMTVTTTFSTASGECSVGPRGKKCKMVTELLDAKSETVLDGNAGVRKQGSFMYTNARETAIYALAVEQREVFDLFIQLADPTCAIGFVTVAPLAHYVTGIEDLSYHDMQQRVFESCGGILLGWRDFSKYHPELNPNLKHQINEWDDMSNFELIILRPPDKLPGALG